MYCPITSPIGSSLGTQESSLKAILSSNVNFVLWQRRLSHFLDTWAQQIKWDKSEILQGEVDLETLDEFEEDLFSELSKWRTGEPDMTKWVAQDMCLNIKLFINTCELQDVFVKIEPVATDMCRLFHVDNNHLRMLCTYTGQGTHWLPNHNANRKFLGKGNNENIVIDPSNIYQAQKLDVLILKGERNPDNNIGGAIHRSPPLKTGERRLLLKVDARP